MIKFLFRCTCAEAILILLFPRYVSSQSTPLYIPRNIQKAIDKGTRTTEGTPGKNYWQNSAAYDLNISFQPKKRLVEGTAVIEYTNNSPDTLKGIIFKLAPNLFKKDAMRLVEIAEEDESDGMLITKLTIGDSVYNAGKLEPQGTILPVSVKPFPPHSSRKITVSYSYILNKTSHNRTGQVDEGSYFIAYSFPRVAVYDDIDNWDSNPYTDNYEFYNDFCDFNVAITVPKNFVIWATGDLENPSDVLNEKIVQRLKEVETSDHIMDVIDSNDVKDKNVTAHNRNNTWKFKARHVTDFAFALSDHYIWKAASPVVDAKTGRRTRVDAAFNPKHHDFFDVAGFAKKTVELMSYYFPKWPFPYPHETVFEGLDQMEYPMMVNDNPLADRAESIELTDHEIFHTMFPFYMGINETKYGWMDEGWATIGEWLLSPMIDSSDHDNYGIDRYRVMSGKEIDLPIMTLTTLLQEEAAFANSYPKPALGYLYVKEMLGDSLFFKGLHQYIQTWNGKHPMPYDFFNCMNAGSGTDLNWFWKKWFFEKGFADLAIDTVLKTTAGYQILLSNKGTKPVPAELHLEFADGTAETVKENVSIWKNSSAYTVEFPSGKELKKVTLSGMYIPDVNKKNNSYTVVNK